MRSLVIGYLLDGYRPIEIADRLSVSYEAVHTIAKESGIRYPGKHLTDAEKKTLQRLREIEGLPIRVIAAYTGIPKTTVGVWARNRFLQVQDEGGKKVRPDSLKVPRRCPRHGLVRLWPCVACAADPI